LFSASIGGNTGLSCVAFDNFGKRTYYDEPAALFADMLKLLTQCGAERTPLDALELLVPMLDRMRPAQVSMYTGRTAPLGQAAVIKSHPNFEDTFPPVVDLIALQTQAQLIHNTRRSQVHSKQTKDSPIVPAYPGRPPARTYGDKQLRPVAAAMAAETGSKPPYTGPICTVAITKERNYGGHHANINCFVLHPSKAPFNFPGFPADAEKDTAFRSACVRDRLPEPPARSYPQPARQPGAGRGGGRDRGTRGAGGQQDRNGQQERNGQ
jgi:hypothetical protein